MVIGGVGGIGRDDPIAFDQFFPSIVEANAETLYFSAEQYTESDKLLLPDGTPSPNRSIKNFATDVKSGYTGQSFPELAQVVPLEYLETTEENAEFSYNGKEYGFYIAKEGNYNVYAREPFELS